ncbi:MAG: EamA family transporter [Candidatus Marsarchaeota archaeon]|jgi:drug/metabolite transporter (DMT)-like permease|nr:EamA family transporter [Candidatus Marsarchaeota archaeon]MCL5112003.1 EamA family transporter [Candidatus Marsarchaeota archaeon]
MSALPIVAGLVAMLCWGTTDYLAAKASRKIGHQRTTVYLLLTSSLVLLIPVAFFLSYSNVTITDILLAVITGGVFAFFANFFTFRAFRYGDVSVNAPMVNSYPIIQVIGAIFFLGVVVSNLELVAITAIIIGIILVSTKFSAFKTKKRILAAGVISAIVAMVFTGTPVLFSSLYIAALGFALTNLTWRGIGMVFGFAYGYATKQSLAVPEKRYLPYVIGAGALDAIAATAFLYAFFLKTANLPVISALAGFSGGVTVILALVFLKERPELNQWIGIILVVGGAVLLSYIF